MRDVSRYEDFLSRVGSEQAASELQLEAPLDDQYQFIGGVDVILPYLPGRINPKLTTEAASMPIRGDLPPVDRDQ
jgi:hypothetical protein